MGTILTHPLFNLAVGSAVTWIAAWYYYKRAGDQLRKEAQTLQAATRAIVYFLENPGARITVQRDNTGNIKGLVVNTAGKAEMKFAATGTLKDVADT